MKKLSNLLLALPVIFFFACETAVREKPINEYYDVESLIDRQSKLLTELQPKIEKSIEVDGKKEKDTMEFDSLGWKNELEVFKLADINKPTLFDQYEATEEKNGDGKIWRYTTAKPSLGIEYLYVYFDNDSSVTKLEARYHENNALYVSERNFEINFKKSDNLIVLDSYKIFGRQKMAMKDEVRFSIESEVVD
jgi:ferric iron reductase protein FhuF